ncbi:uncharacterized protein LOC122133266 [Clupea harengus]|uniref:Uncharacterized protein LOC122133266 n=1 Tax=Clupea harengus TaxID=7950 RepID=A0A8M1KLR9_CLUHA|nr:uncharacterized protein LOC122133266 [Clupea harengus]
MEKAKDPDLHKQNNQEEQQDRSKTITDQQVLTQAQNGAQDSGQHQDALHALEECVSLLEEFQRAVRKKDALITVLLKTQKQGAGDGLKVHPAYPSKVQCDTTESSEDQTSRSPSHSSPDPCQSSSDICQSSPDICQSSPDPCQSSSDMCQSSTQTVEVQTEAVDQSNGPADTHNNQTEACARTPVRQMNGSGGEEEEDREEEEGKEEEEVTSSSRLLPPSLRKRLQEIQVLDNVIARKDKIIRELSSHNAVLMGSVQRLTEEKYRQKEMLSEALLLMRVQHTHTH